ncbi:MAG: hypothetical protein ACEPOW_13775 [Bacteroidales bacterium]
MFELSKRSKDNMSSTHRDLQIIVETAIMVTQVDFIVTEGGRSDERQNKLLSEGKTTVKRGKHNVKPKSEAFDFCAYIKGKPELAYDKVHLMYLVGVFTSIGELLYKQGVITHKVRSGANWDRDGELLYDQTFWDAPHIEII